VQVGVLGVTQRELIGGPAEIVVGGLRAIPARIAAGRRRADQLQRRCHAAAEQERERERDDEPHAAMVRTASCARLALALRRVNR
jgi:hypothetical protein